MERIEAIVKPKLKNSMLKASLCGYSDVYILVKEIEKVLNTLAAYTATNDTNKKVIIKYCVPFSDWIS